MARLVRFARKWNIRQGGFEAVAGGGAVEGDEIIESHSDDKYFPSYLLLAWQAADAYDILLKVDVEEDHVRVVTAYRPKSSEWESDLRTRRR